MRRYSDDYVTPEPEPQASLHPRCPRCGSPVLDDREVGGLVETAIEELHDRATYVPDSVYSALKNVAGQMRCRGGTCV